MPVGPLVARVYLFKEGQLLGQYKSRVMLEREGIERYIHDSAIARPLLYGIVTVIMAAAAGLAAASRSVVPRDRSVVPEKTRRDRIEPLVTKHPHRQSVAAEQRLEGDVEDVEPAGVGAERWHHEAKAVADEARPAQRSPVQHEPRSGMKVSGDFVRRPRRAADS